MKISLEDLEINIDGTHCKFDIIHRRLGIGIKGAGCAYQLGDAMIEPDQLTPESESETKTGGWIKYTSKTGGACKLSFDGLDGGVMVQLAVESKGNLGDIAPMVVEGEDSGIELGGDVHKWRLLRMGYQSWSPSGSMGILDAEPYPPMGLLAQAAFHPRPTLRPARGRHHLDWATVIFNPENSKCILIGFLSARRYLSSIEMEVQGGNVDHIELRASSDAELTPPRGDETARSSEKLWIAFGDDPHALWERYLDLAGREMNARIPKKTPVGWCSWYHYFAKVNEKDVRDNLDRLAAVRDELGVDLVQLDDGYCKPGDWFDWNEKFPSGPKSLAGSISEKGFTPGLWLAPFICTRASKLYREKPDLLLKNERGKPILCSLNPMWKGVAYYALDMTNPAAVEHVRKMMTTVREWGFRYVKIDFVFAAALRGNRYDPAATGAEAYRAGVQAIRDALGDDVFLLGCGAPILPSVGLVDAMRISADVAPKWRDPMLRMFTRAPFEPACENAIHGTMCRAAMHRRLWLNDPDCLLVRKDRSKLSLDEVRSLATVMFLSGGMIVLSDNMAELDPDRWEIVRQVSPLLDRRARTVDLFDKSNPAVFHVAVQNSDRHLVALINWGDKPAQLAALFDPMGIKGPHHAFEFWSEKYLGVVKDKIGPLNLAAHGCAFVSLVPADDKPRLLSASFHLGQGAMGVARERIVDGKFEIEFALKGQRKGRLYVIVPGESAPRRVEADFKDSAKVTVPTK